MDANLKENTSSTPQTSTCGWQKGKLISFGIAPTGYISIGIVPMGIISIGIVPMGVISFGMVAMGTIASGLVSMGILALGVESMSLVNLGSWMMGPLEVKSQPHNHESHSNPAINNSQDHQYHHH